MKKNVMRIAALLLLLSLLLSLTACGEKAKVIGRVEDGDQGVVIC